MTNAAGGYTHGGSQGYSTSGFNGNNNHLERHESGVCGESDNGLGEADEQDKRTNQCFGGEGGDGEMPIACLLLALPLVDAVYAM